MRLLSPTEVSEIRKARSWSQQYLSQLSGVNKAYISEYESGVRPMLPEEMLERLSRVLLAAPAGRAHLQFEDADGHQRLVVIGTDGTAIRPRLATVHWTEEDGTSFTMFVGDVD
jgi:transcriptional regulator with XRE-family HTH domain